MCRYTDHRLQREPSFNGDRILVGKFLYQYEEPERFDVAVFKFPAEAKTNYIKRVAGLPGETIRIGHGDLFVKKAARRSSRSPESRRRSSSRCSSRSTTTTT